MEIKRPEGMMMERDLSETVQSIIPAKVKDYQVTTGIEGSNTIDVEDNYGAYYERRIACIRFKKLVQIDKKPILARYDFLQQDVDNFLCISKETDSYKKLLNTHTPDNFRFKVTGYKDESYLTTFESQTLSYVHYYEIQIDITDETRTQSANKIIEMVKRAVSD